MTKSAMDRCFYSFTNLLSRMMSKEIGTHSRCLSSVAIYDIFRWHISCDSLYNCRKPGTACGMSFVNVDEITFSAFLSSKNAIFSEAALTVYAKHIENGMSWMNYEI